MSLPLPYPLFRPEQRTAAIAPNNGATRSGIPRRVAVLQQGKGKTMLETTSRIVMTGLAAVTLGALSGWVLMDKLQPNPVPAASASTTVAPAADRRLEDTSTPARRQEVAAPTRAPAAAPAPAPTKVASPAPAPAKVATPAPEAPAPAAAPARETSDKPEIRIDPDRREASLGIGGSRFSAGFDGRRIKLKGPGGIDLEFDVD